MSKTILITGATDGIGLETAKALVADGHEVLIHGRSADKLKKTVAEMGGDLPTYRADLSDLKDVENFAQAVAQDHGKLDVLINNAGVFKTHTPKTKDGLDVRFIVNTVAPYLLMQKLSGLLRAGSRVVNLSSAAQAPLNLEALENGHDLTDMEAYAQSKLAITMWTAHAARMQTETGPMIVSVNPGSLLGTKMVREGFGTQGHDIRIGVDILIKASLSAQFEKASGRYFDNDAGQFAPLHPGALDADHATELVEVMDRMIANLTQKG